MTEGFEEWVLARGDALHRTALLLTRDHGLAEDLVQTALARSWPAWRRIHADPEHYVRRVMVNTYSSWWRRRWNGERPTAVNSQTAKALARLRVDPALSTADPEPDLLKERS
jgi:DNA-directed RNA polymerase specialized sigma24 family protein